MSNPFPPALEHFHTLAANYEATTGGCTRELAGHLIDILPTPDSSSSILDNACGNGIVAQELLSKYPDVPLHLTCTDGAQGMVDLAKHTVGAKNQKATLLFDTMPGEQLAFPDAHFTHSITNQGIMFFNDGAKGAQEIHRTLKPGGTAVLTTWKHLGYLDLVHQAQRAARPNDPPFRIPIADGWFTAAYLEQALRDAGFEDVQVHEKQVHWAAESTEKCCENLEKLFAMVWKGWNDEDTVAFKKQLRIAVEKAVVNVQRPVSGASSGETENLVGVVNVALVAVAKK